MGSGGPTARAAETLDRVVASLGNTAVTASEVEQEYRFELFLDSQLPAAAPDAATLERVRDRLVNQTLLAQEAEAESLDRTDLPRRAAEALAEVRKKYASEEAFQSALHTLGRDEAQVLQRLERHESALRIIDERLRPTAWVEPSEIEAYYQKTFVPAYLQRKTGRQPALEEVESQIREILVQQKIDQLLAAWLEELRASQRVRLHSF